jgi:hypothetical protein
VGKGVWEGGVCVYSVKRGRLTYLRAKHSSKHCRLILEAWQKRKQGEECIHFQILKHRMLLMKYTFVHVPLLDITLFKYFF